MSHLTSIYRPGFGNLTDLYQLTMAYGYWQQGLAERRSVFHLFYRKPPFGDRFAIAAGLPLALDLIERLRFSADDVQYLGGLTGRGGRPLFTEPFLNYLQRLRFTGDVYAIPEGEAVFPHEPLLRIEAPLIQAQLLETALLTIMNFSTLIATKAARLRAAAGPDDSLLEFGLRRAQGIDGGLTGSRAAYLGGCDATSNVWAGQYYGIPVRGTHAHSWVMVHDTEPEAFAAYAEAMPHNCTLLVDTYDTVEGVKNAIEVGRQLRKDGHDLAGIRLDSGDLAALSIAARQLLDEAGFTETAIVASNDLDEYRIAELKAAGAPITVWGVGTRLATAYDQPALGGVYKLAAIANEAGELEDRIKLSEQRIKTSLPGRLQVRRFTEAATRSPLGSLIYDVDAGPASGFATGTPVYLRAAQTSDLLQPYIVAGEAVASPTPLSEARAAALRNYPVYQSALADGTTFALGISGDLEERRRVLRASPVL